MGMVRGQRYRESTGHRGTIILADQWHPLISLYNITEPRPAHPPDGGVSVTAGTDGKGGTNFSGGLKGTDGKSSVGITIVPGKGTGSSASGGYNTGGIGIGISVGGNGVTGSGTFGTQDGKPKPGGGFNATISSGPKGTTIVFGWGGPIRL